MSLPSAPRMRTLYSSMAARDEASGRSVVVSLMCCGMTCLSNREIQACFRNCGELGPTGVGTASPRRLRTYDVKAGDARVLPDWRAAANRCVPAQEEVGFVVAEHRRVHARLGQKRHAAIAELARQRGEERPGWRRDAGARELADAAKHVHVPCLVYLSPSVR